MWLPLKRSKWPLAPVVEIQPGKDQSIRSAKSMTIISELVRPLVILYLLEEVS